MCLNNFVHHPVNEEEPSQQRKNERSRGRTKERMAKQHQRKKGEVSQEETSVEKKTKGWNGCDGIKERQEGGVKDGRL